MKVLWIKSFIGIISIILLLASCSKDDVDPAELFIGKWIQIDERTGQHLYEDVIHEYGRNGIFKVTYISTGEIDSSFYYIEGSYLYLTNTLPPPKDINFYRKYKFVEESKLLLECDVCDFQKTFLYKRIN